MNVPSSDRASVWRYSGESHVCAKVVIAARAFEAVVTRHARFHRYSIARLQMLDVGP